VASAAEPADQYPLDAGTDMRSILKALQANGDCTEALSPDMIDPTLAEYSDAKQIVPPMDKSAALYKIDGYGFIDKPSMAQIKQAIYQYGSVIALVDIGDGWWANGRTEAATCPLKLGNAVGRHFVVLSRLLASIREFLSFVARSRVGSDQVDSCLLFRGRPVGVLLSKHL
jgi:hypothetical protein